MRSGVLTFLKSVLTGSIRFKAAPRLLGRYSPGEGAGQEIKLGAGLSLEGDTLSASTAIEVSPGGNGNADEGKVAAFGEYGNLTASEICKVKGREPGVSISLDSYYFPPYLEFADHRDGIKNGRLTIASLPEIGTITWTLPDTGGIIPSIAAEASRAGAEDSPYLEPREVWWDQTEKKAWAKCTGWLGIASSNPAGAMDGDIYANDIAGKIRMYLGGSWWDLGDWTT